jgi:Helix-turn-helix.
LQDQPLSEDVVVGRQLGDARLASGFSQAEVARRMGVAQSRIAKLELGHRRLLFLEALLLGEMYGVPIESFDPRTAPPIEGPRARRRRVDSRSDSRRARVSS